MNKIALYAVLILFPLCPALAEGNNVFTGANASAAITSALAKQGITGDLDVSINNVRDEDEITSSAQPITATVDSLNIDKARDGWKAVLLLKSGDRNLAQIGRAS